MSYTSPVHKTEVLRGRPEKVAVYRPASNETIKVLESGCPVVVSGLYAQDKVPNSATDKVYMIADVESDQADLIIWDCRDCAYYTLQYATGTEYQVGDPLTVKTDASGKPIFDKAGVGEWVVGIVVDAPSDPSKGNEMLGFELLLTPYQVQA